MDVIDGQVVYSSGDFVSAATWKDPPDTWCSKFDDLVRGKWQKAMDDGHFRYQLSILQNRILPGEKKFIAQLNPLRLQERRSPQRIESLQLPYNPDRFNFTKIQLEEILFDFCPVEPPPVENGPTTRKPLSRRHLVIINVSPLEFGHILLVPDVNAGIHQRLTLTAIQLSLEFLHLSSHPGLRIGFNGLCALASVNHQHVHAWYINHQLYTENAAGMKICEGCYEMQEDFIQGFIMQQAGQSIEQLAGNIFKMTNYMQQNEIAHNVFFTRGSTLEPKDDDPQTTIRVYIWPRKKFLGQKMEDGTPAFFVAVAEMAGHLPCYLKEGYESLTEEKVTNMIKEGSRLQDKEYKAVKENVIKTLIS